MDSQALQGPMQWRFAVYYPADPEAAVKIALSAADLLLKTYGTSGLTRADAWYFAVHNPADPEATVKTAFQLQIYSSRRMAPQALQGPMHGDLLSTIQQTRRPQLKKPYSAVDLLLKTYGTLGLTRA